MMKRTVYEAPLTEHFQVEMEGVFCASAKVTNGDKDLAGINGQEINEDFSESADFSNHKWD